MSSRRPSSSPGAPVDRLGSIVDPERFKLLTAVSKVAVRACQSHGIGPLIVFFYDSEMDYFRPLGAFDPDGSTVDGLDDAIYCVVRGREIPQLFTLNSAAPVSDLQLPESLVRSLTSAGISNLPLLVPLHSGSELFGFVVADTIGAQGDRADYTSEELRSLAKSLSEYLETLVPLVELSRSESMLRLLDRVSSALIAEVGVEEVIQLAIEGVSSLFGSGEVRYVTRVTPGGDTTKVIASSAGNPERHGIRTVKEGASGYVFSTGSSALIGDRDAKEFWPKYPSLEPFFVAPKLSALSSMAAPVFNEMGRVVAVIGATHEKPGMFSHADLRILESLCAKLSSVIQREELFTIYRRRVGELELLRRLSIGTSGTRSYVRLAREVGGILRSDLHVLGGFLAVADGRGWSDPMILPLVDNQVDLELPYYDPSDGFSWKHGEPLPIISGNDTIGYLFVKMAEGPDAIAEWLRLMQSVSHQLGSALANVMAYNSSLSAAEEAGTAAAKAHREAEKIRAITDTVRDVIIVFSAQGNVEFVTPSVTEISGYSPEEVTEMGLKLIETASRRRIFIELRRMIADFQSGRETVGSDHSIELEVYSAGGSLVLLEVKLSLLHGTLGQVEGFVASARDVSARKELEESLRYSAYHDPLTGLPNRRMIEQRLTEALSIRSQTASEVAILFVDLDGFKRINDTMGHEAGDQVLLEVTQRIVACVRPYDTVGRLGGDEFVVLLEGVVDRNLPAAIARRVTESLEGNIYISERQLLISASIGVAVSSPSTTDASELLRRADAAMYGAKRSGGSISVGEQDQHLSNDRSLLLAPELLLALDNSELELHFQPIVQIRTGEIVGYEGLLRWYHESLGWVPPADFVPSGEAAGLAGALARVVLNEAISMIRKLSAIGSDAWVSINYSPRQFVSKRLEELLAVLTVAGREVSSRLVVEITETSALYWDDDVAKWVNKLDSLGVRFALDDFGSGFSSLSNLRDLPVQIVKVDRKFVQGAPEARMDGAIVGAVLMMARSKGAMIIGEGVETPDQLALLRTMGVDMAQGYLISRARTVSDVLLYHESLYGVWQAS